MERRHFINLATQAGVALCFADQLSALNLKKKPSIGVLLGSVEKYMTENADDTLGEISAMGFKELEFPRTYGYPVDKLKAIINNHKLTALGGGDNITHLNNNFAEYAAEYNEIGKQYVFCYWPWFDGGLNKTIDDWKKQAEVLNKLGERYKKEGLRLAYHNHNIEFAETEKQIPYDILLQNTNPEFLTFQMDIWWIRKGGQWPLDFIEKYPGRFEVCHIKTAGLIKGNEEVQNLDYRKVLEKSKSAGFKHFVLENEPEIEDPFTYFQKSHALINSYF